MNRLHPSAIVPTCITLVLTVGGPGLAGDLTPPPGAVAPTMKTLTEVEPRIAINATNTPGDADSLYRISQRGSYYLTDNITGVAGKSGIEIVSSGVSVDLMGFSLDGGPGSTFGVVVPITTVISSLVIRNGSIRGWPQDGVRVFTTSCQIEGIKAIGNGGNGIAINYNFLFLDSNVACSVLGCEAANNSGTGIYINGGGSRITSCIANSNGNYGIFAGFGAVNGITVSSSTANFNSFSGIDVGIGNTVIGCSASYNISNGIRCDGNSLISSNTCVDNGYIGGNGAAIRVTGNDAQIEGNFCTGADRGLDIDGSNTHIEGNTVRDNTDNYDIAPGNHLNLIISQLPESIDWPAAVTLAGDLTGVTGQNGLTINADGVTIDLAGHGLIGVGGSLAGISVPATRKNLTVKNGRVASWGGPGIGAANADSSLFSDLLVTSNAGGGVIGGEGCNFQRVTADSNTGDGLLGGSNCVIDACIARSNSARGLAASSGSLVTGSSAISNGTIGINPDTNSVITHCVSRSNTEDGIVGFSGTEISNCSAGRNTLNGIKVTTGCLVLNNSCQGNGNGAGDGANILATNSRNRIEGNNCTSADRGIDVDGAGNIIVRNTCSGNTTNWDVVAGNVILVVNATTAGAVTGNSGGTAPGSTDPNANFTY